MAVSPNDLFAASEKVYGDNPSLHQTKTAMPDGWSYLTDKNGAHVTSLNNDHGFFAEAFTDGHGNIIIAFCGSIIKPDGSFYVRPVLPNATSLPFAANSIEFRSDYLSAWGSNSRGADLAILNYGTPEAFNDALAFTNTVMDANKTDTIYLTGHSSGGAQAEFVANALGGNEHFGGGATFGAPGIFKVAPPATNTNFTNYIDYGDPIANYGVHFGSTYYTGEEANKAGTKAINDLVGFVRDQYHPPSVEWLFSEVQTLHLQDYYLDHTHPTNLRGILALKVLNALATFPRDDTPDIYKTLSTYHGTAQYEKDVKALPLPPPTEKLLFSENFDFGQTASAPYIADLAQHGWTNVNNGGKTTAELLPKDSFFFGLLSGYQRH